MTGWFKVRRGKQITQKTLWRVGDQRASAQRVVKPRAVRGPFSFLGVLVFPRRSLDRVPWGPTLPQRGKWVCLAVRVRLARTEATENNTGTPFASCG